jgi:hypothetical protein
LVSVWSVRSMADPCTGRKVRPVKPLVAGRYHDLATATIVRTNRSSAATVVDDEDKKWLRSWP